MDTTTPRSLDELTVLVPVFAAAIAAILVGLALMAEGIADARFGTPRTWRNGLRRFTALCSLNLLPPADQELGTINSLSRRYTLTNQLGGGDLADLYSAMADGHEYVVKIARPRAAGSLLLAEARWLSMLADKSGRRSYGEYFPRIVESLAAGIGGEPRRVNIFEHRPGYFTLKAVRKLHPTGLDARHLAWIFKRMLAALGFAHACGLVHGAVLPPHVMIHPENHGLQFLDWIHAVPVGRQLEIVPAAYRDWYPRESLDGETSGAATDIYLAAKSLIYLAGGDPIAERWPVAVPEPLRRFVNTCLYPAARMRPQDAWKLHEEFDELLLRLFGPPKYHRLVMA